MARRPQPLIDLVLAILLTIVLYLASDALARSTFDVFWVLIGVFLAGDIVWTTLCLGREGDGGKFGDQPYLQRANWMNIAALGLGMTLFVGARVLPASWLSAAEPFALAGILLLKTLLDFRVGYYILFPWASPS